MDFFTGLIVFLLTWWVVIFAVLPWGNKAPKEPLEGNATSAPDNPRLRQKFIITTLISFVVLILVYTLIEMNVIDFRAISQDMFLEKMQEGQ